MRILLASDFFAPHVGGVELQVQALGEALAEAGHEVVVATVRQRGLPESARIGGVRVERLPTLLTSVPWFSSNAARRYHPPFPDPRLAMAMRRLVRRSGADVVQAHGWIAHSAALGLTGTGIPLVTSVRDYGYACATRNLLLHDRPCSGPALAKCLRHASTVYGPVKGPLATAAVLGLRRWIARRTALFHAVSSFVASAVQRDVVRAADRPVAVVPDIVIEEPPERSAAAAHGVPGLPDRPYVLFVGALQRHKGLEPLLAAHRMLQRDVPLALIGTRWPDTPSFPTDVAVLSDVAHADVMRAWDGALFGVAPSIWPDPLPGVIREAMSRGKPVIGSRIGGIPDIIRDGENGLLVPPNDPAALAAAMRRLIDDEPLRSRLGARARADTAEFRPQTIAGSFLTLWEDVRRDGAASRPGARPGSAVEARPRRVHITGGSGAGKSTLARRISVLLDAPVHHLDEIARDPGTGMARSDATRTEAIARITATPAWVTEGIHTGWTEDLLRQADVILWLDHVDDRLARARVVRRFVADAWRNVRVDPPVPTRARLARYARHLRDVRSAMGEIGAYHGRPVAGAAAGTGTVEPVAGSPTADTRAVLAAQLQPHAAKVVVCRTADDIERYVETLEVARTA